MNNLPIIDSCDGCGSCCLEQSSPPMYLAYLCWPDYMLKDADEDDLNRFRSLPESAMQSLREYREQDELPDGEVCIWFDEETRGCKHYEHRPQICREFERGCEACHEWRNQYPPVTVQP